MEKKDFQLIKKCKEGDPSVKECLYKEYAPMFLRICQRYVNNKMLAQDVLQESYIPLFEEIANLKNEHTIDCWMRRMVVNNTLMYQRKHDSLVDIDDVKESEISTEEEDNQGIKEQILQLDISQQKMLEIINNRPTVFRTVFNLYVFENYSNHEIAKELRISSDTSRSIRLMDRRLIQKKLQKKDEVLLSSLVIIMRDDLKYIDKLTTNKLAGYSPLSSSLTHLTYMANNAGKNNLIRYKRKLYQFLVRNNLNIDIDCWYLRHFPN